MGEVGYSRADVLRDMRGIWRWDVVLGAGGIGFAVASAGQAAANNRADVWIFSTLAVVLLAAAAVLLVRASRIVAPDQLGFVVVMCAVGGLSNWHLRWWVAGLAWIVISTPVAILAGHHNASVRRKTPGDAAEPTSTVDG